MPKISVLMPVYNTPEKYLREAIDSILGQTYQDFEFLIIDDGSTEKHVKATVDSYQDSRIKYFYKENGDIGDALNYGLKLSKSEFIARMDADDISLPNRLQRQLDFLTKDLNKQKQIKLTLCDDKRWFKIGLPLLSVAVSKTYIGVFIFGCIKIFSKKRLRK